MVGSTDRPAMTIAVDLGRKATKQTNKQCYSYTMACPPVRGYNPRALASGLSYVQVDTFVNMA